MKNTPENKSTKKPAVLTIIALVILIIGALFSFGGSLIMLGSSLITLAFPVPFNSGLNIFSTLSSTTMLAVFGALSIPGIVFLIQKLSTKYQQKAQGKEDPFNEMPFSRMMAPNIILAVTILLLVVTYLLSSRWEFVRWILPFLQVPAILVPIYWLVQFATRKVYPRASKRHWIALGLNLTVQPVLAVSVEIVIMLLMLIPVILYVALNPNLIDQIMVALNDFNSATMSVEEMEAAITVWLGNPIVILFIQVFVAVLVPLVEELIKPILVFRWIKRPLSQMDGFWLGLIGGAAFSIYETFGNIANMSLINDWYSLLLARVGTSLLHMGTTALMGWALMKTFNDRKWLRLPGIYAVSVLLHGGWNFFAIIEGLSALPMETASGIFILNPIALPVMIMIAAICTVIIIFGVGKIQKNETLSALQQPEKSEVV